MNLQAPISYQGGKQRIADDIVSVILRYADVGDNFHDLCCGSGAISVAMVNRGIKPQNITMIDASPWGLFWKKVGNGTFSLSKFKGYIDQLPKPEQMQSFVKELSQQEASIDPECVFLILQAASFGGKAIWFNANKWQNCSFRNYWLPTEKSNRRSPVNPMMPMPNTLYSRVAIICERMLGVNGKWLDVRCADLDSGVIYIDPPYDGTTKYGSFFDLKQLLNLCKAPCFVSEGKPLDGAKYTYKISSARKKGGISGERKIAPSEEWVSVFNVEGRHENLLTLFS